ncbi:TraB/GumN family protein [Tunicatimonas pelagia]|uniref:TraB/GumN family protein n=1 Tax=Tunicatimonas pelagia TaxID=931531 RepID=UPI002665A39F|nr:TraB/GumN family protein [Tunicatimonas pelagia]WKN43897.1 TraB/GumN family protein [Tunicatimonas pelagia]
MKKTLIATCLAMLLLGLSTKAQDTDALLWQVSGNNLAQPSYLFGTIHLMCPDDIQITQPMKDALKNSEQLVLELDMDEPGMMMNMQKVAMMTDGTTLNDLLTEEEYQLVGNYLKDSLQLPIQALNTMKPLMLSTLTFLDVLNCRPGSYEMQLVQQAKEHKKEVLGLETIEDQTEAFDFIPLEEQADYLVEAIQKYDETVAETEALLTAYQQGQVAKLYDLTHEAMSEMEGAEEALLTKRNKKWIAQIEDMAQNQATFFAVGAAHLGGPEGVITLLKEQGYTVEAISSAGQ